MLSRDKKKEPGTDYSPLAKADLRTSRRNFIAAASVLATAGILAIGSKPAKARQDGIPGCGPSGGQPNKCVQHHCFLSGTHIATPDGQIVIDELRIGDLVTTVSGRAKPIKWIGRNRYTRTSSETWTPDLLPVRVAKFALSDHTPNADLFLSPGHALYLQGLLIPVVSLANGRSIVSGQRTSSLELDYFHIELEDHSAVLAEGAAAETFDGSNRFGFDNAEEYERLYGALAGPTNSFAPRVLGGGRQELRSRLRSAIAPIYDARKPFDIIWDHIACRAELGLAA